MSKQWHGGKGDAPRKQSDQNAYEDGWDRIFGSKKDMTPQELSDYKRTWLSKNPHCVQVDVDSHIWGKDWCRKNLQRQYWSFDKYTQPDDSHTFLFENLSDAESFIEAYTNYNPRFPTEVV